MGEGLETFSRSIRHIEHISILSVNEEGRRKEKFDEKSDANFVQEWDTFLLIIECYIYRFVPNTVLLEQIGIYSTQ